ncbi:hypothetical protein SDC9_160742 [bioreactor metagenome]|uniref:Uncharacterized protein n=1 Tax=bioreactor metagenome TaxID=1076179 RepID=A0A645FGD2_9ZZZZ
MPAVAVARLALAPVELAVAVVAVAASLHCAVGVAEPLAVALAAQPAVGQVAVVVLRPVPERAAAAAVVAVAAPVLAGQARCGGRQMGRGHPGWDFRAACPAVPGLVEPWQALRVARPPWTGDGWRQRPCQRQSDHHVVASTPVHPADPVVGPAHLHPVPRRPHLPHLQRSRQHAFHLAGVHPAAPYRW